MELFACGCGHDGRLAQGRSEANHAALIRVTLPWSAAAALHRIHHVACGGYHTLVVLDAADVDPSFFLTGSEPTSSTPDGGASAAAVDALPARLAAVPPHTRAIITVAFGLNEDGQLGVGDRYNKSKPTLVKALSTDATRLVVVTVGSDFERQSDAATSPLVAPRLTRLCSLTCGLYHSLALCADEEWTESALVRATTTVRSCGRNASGQLGLGDFDGRAQWTDVPLPHITDVVPAVAPASDLLELNPPVVLPLAPDLQWWVEACAAGSSHSALLVRATTGAELPVMARAAATVPLAVASAAPLAPSATSKSAPLQADWIADARAFVREAALRYVLTCGMGDYGELGYDADAWDAQRDAEARLKRGITENARLQGMMNAAGSAVVGGAASSGPDEAAVAEALREQADRVEAALQGRPSYLANPSSASRAPYKFKKPTAKRRAPLSRPSMHHVDLHTRAVFASSSDSVTDARVASTVYLPLGVAASAFRTHLTGTAMHLASTVAAAPTAVPAADAIAVARVDTHTVLAFGCLYDRRIETLSASVPVELCAPLSAPVSHAACGCRDVITAALGLKDVECIVTSPCCTCGAGDAGRGDRLYIRGDDPFDPAFLRRSSGAGPPASTMPAPVYDAVTGDTPAVPIPGADWTLVPLPAETSRIAITGKAEHLLVTSRGGMGNAFALGSNYYGQLGMLSAATVDRAADLDVELEKREAPVRVAAPFGVAGFVAAAAGSQHSMFLCATPQ
jgi:hypothetical protein